MSENGTGAPLIKFQHVIDAGIVAGIVFFSVLGGDVLTNLSTGEVVLLTVNDVAQRLLTAGLAFCLTFLAQFARYRGIKLRAAILGYGPDVPHEEDD